MDKETILKPCPFCGIPAEVFRQGGGPGWRVYHWNRGVECPIDMFDQYPGVYNTSDDAIAAWNERLLLEVPRAFVRAEPDAGKLSGTTEEVEILAAYAHHVWAGWIDYMFTKIYFHDDGTFALPVWAVDRWRRQASTAYDALPDDEKNSDRKEALAILSLIRNKLLDWQG